MLAEYVVAVGGEARPSRRRRAEKAAADALEGLTTTPGECAEDVCTAPGAPCSSARVVAAVADFAAAVAEAAPAPAPAPAEDALLPTAATAEAAAVRTAAAALQCDSESCVLTHPAFRRHAAAAGVPPAALDRELEARFKARGPRDSLALLSNYNIDDTLRRWARVFPELYPCPFAMMDFDRTQEPFATIDMGDVLAGRAQRPPARCFACVVNTDVSSGPGRHWVAVFVDCRGADAWSAEYFNSAGRPPPRPMVAWLERTRARLAELRGGGREPPGPVEVVPVTSVDHQESQTECGLYALFYIRRRLEGAPHTLFVERIVPDEAMTRFRAHVFRAR